jgi:hypothetical protein
MNSLKDSLHDVSRREFLRLGGITAVGISMPELYADEAKPAGATMMGVPFAPVTPKIGIIGTGGRGTSLLENLLAAEVKVLA